MYPHFSIKFRVFGVCTHEAWFVLYLGNFL